MKIPIQISHITARFDSKTTNGFIVDCDEEKQIVYVQEEDSKVKLPMPFETFNKFYLSNSNFKLGHYIENTNTD